MTARSLFNEVYEGRKNFMTPDRIWCRFVGKFAVEIAQGRGIENQPIFGVTVLDRHTKEVRNDLCKLYQFKANAMDYAKILRSFN